MTSYKNNDSGNIIILYVYYNDIPSEDEYVTNIYWMYTNQDTNILYETQTEERLGNISTVTHGIDINTEECLWYVISNIPNGKRRNRRWLKSYFSDIKLSEDYEEALKEMIPYSKKYIRDRNIDIIISD